ncbi:MAG: fumarate reductase subunit C [Succinivibrionaceae bacterium]|jgi:fumarate reductase subunit C|nr:fumarate reductase subunit C [Succinivibrionaceae bacterium]
MELNKSTRKPYVRPVKANWWTNKGFYIAYMLREGTCIPIFLFVLELLWAYACIACGAASKDPMAGLQRIMFAKSIIQNPLVICFNILVLVAVVYHAITWFNLMPKAQRLFIGNKLVDGKYFVIALYAVTILVTIFGAICFFSDFLWLFLK